MLLQEAKMTNREIAAVFREIADMLEIKGEDRYRVLAYRRAADQIANEPRSVADLWREGTVTGIPGIGKAIADKIGSLLTTGQIDLHERLKAEIPTGVVTLLNVPDVGPKKAKLLWEQLGVTSIDDLERAARAGKLRGLPGIGAKTEANILRGIEILRRRTGRSLLGVALPVAEALLAGLRQSPAVVQCDAAGSLRRRKPTIGDLDLLAASTEPVAVIDHFVRLPRVASVQARGDTKCTVWLEDDLQVDLRVLPPDNYGALLQYFTGSKQHNIELREVALEHGLSLSEYGFTTADGTLIPIADEAEVYARLDLAWIPPELREAAGEIEAARQDRLPALIELADVRGDLQMHTTWSDGQNSVFEMAQAARDRGYDYILITDHSQGLGVAGGLTPERYRAQWAEIAEANARLAPFRVLRGAEVEIRADGSLDLPDDFLAEFDLVLASIHSGMRQDRATMTARVIRAIRNPHVDMIAHPTGVLRGEREPIDLDFEAVVAAAAETGTWLEINADPHRLDLDGEHARLARERGVRLTLGSDAHAAGSLAVIPFGVATARRGWCQARDVVNTRGWEELLALTT
jgi:DNA polymerase (family 10)